MKEPIRISGTKFIYELKPNEKWAIIGDRVVVVSPNEEPFMILSSGEKVPVKWNDDEGN